MSEQPFPYRTALVTGASSGIGAALAHRLAQVGVQRITLVARREARLRALADGLSCETSVLCADLMNPEDLSRVAHSAESVDLLVNNAGFGSFGPFYALDTDREIAMVELNCTVPLRLSAAALTGMRQRSHGCVVNIASGQAFQPMPFMSTYAASKAFLLHWTEGVREELHGTGVNMVTVCPGSIETEFNATARVPANFAAMRLVQGSMDGLMDATMDAILHNRGVVVPGLGNYLGTFSSRAFPRAWVRRVLAMVLGGPATRALSSSD